MTMLVTGFSHVLLPVANVNETIDFYTRFLGFNLLRKYNLGESESCYLSLGGVMLEVVSAESDEEPASRLENPIGLVVSDLDAIVALLKANGIECEPALEARSFWGRQAKVRDNSGYLVSLRQYNAPDGPDFADWTPRHEDVVRLA